MAVSLNILYRRLIMGGVRGTVFIAGYLLSPLSWWNDLFINVPIAYAFARLLCIFLGDTFFALMFSLGYTLSNIAGILLIKLSVSRYRGTIIRDLGLSIIYSVIAYIVILAVV